MPSGIINLPEVENAAGRDTFVADYFFVGDDVIATSEKDFDQSSEKKRFLPRGETVRPQAH